MPLRIIGSTSTLFFSLLLIPTGSGIRVAPRAPPRLGEMWAAAKLLSASFEPNRSPVATAVSLYAPWLDAHAFCAPSASTVPLVAVAHDEAESPDGGHRLVGVTQAMLAELRSAAGEGAGRRVVFVQNVAVAPSHRRRGIASRLVVEVERQAVSSWGVDESWLVAAEDDAGLRRLYQNLGYEVRCGSLGQVVMRKHLRPDDQLTPALTAGHPSPTKESQGSLGPRSSAAGLGSRSSAAGLGPRSSAAGLGSRSSAAGLGPRSSAAGPEAIMDQLSAATVCGDADGGTRGAYGGVTALLTEIATQGMYFGVGCLGICFLVQPLGGTRLSELVPSGDAPVAAVCEAALGLGLAGAELFRLGAWPWTPNRMGPITSGQAVQLAPLWRIAGGEARASAALAAIGAWQLSIAIAEETYYRGLVLSGSRSAVLGLGGVGLPVAPPLAALVALLLSSAVFGAVHLEFASAAEPGDAAGGRAATDSSATDDSAARWFGVTAAYGAAYGALFVATGLHLLAPVCLHAGINTGLCMGRWQQLREMDAECARALFVEAEA